MEKLKAYSKVSPSGCWEWQRYILPNGYGNISIGHQRQAYAHRVSYFLFNGPISEGLLVRHKCDNPRCVNPEHLELGTQTDNMQDCKKRGRMSMPPKKIGKDNHKAKLSESAVLEIYNSKEKNSELARRFGVSAVNIGAIKRGKIWQHITQHEVSEK